MRTQIVHCGEFQTAIAARVRFVVCVQIHVIFEHGGEAETLLANRTVVFKVVFECLLDCGRYAGVLLFQFQVVVA